MPTKKEGNRETESINRRDFIRRTMSGGFTALAVTANVFLPRARSRAESSRIAFNTANLVARITHYHFELKNWMDQHLKTVAATDAVAWRSICREISSAGFEAVEIWEAHASPEAMDQAKAKAWSDILKQFSLRPIAYAGSLRHETLQICRWLEIPHIDGGLGNLTPEMATALCKEYGIGFNLENHPEKNAEQILKKIGGGNEWLGVCVDTGWLGSQGVSAPDVIKSCGALVRHTHVKDVKAAGKHETCLLGEGIANVAGCLRTLRSMNYPGWYSWEDEPEDRNPFDSAKRNREWIEKLLT